MSTFLLDPTTVLDFQWDFSANLTSGETISSAEVTAPLGITVAPSGYPTVVGAATVTAWLTGGTDGVRYTVLCKATTSAGRVYEQPLRVRVLDSSATSTLPPPGGAASLYVPASSVGVAGGVASLGGDGIVPAAQLPPAAVVSDATITSKGLVQLAGDLSGTAAAPTVPALASVVTLNTAQTVTALKTFQTAAATAVALVVKATTSQTADLQQWQDDVGTVLARVNNVGAFATADGTVELYPGPAGRTVSGVTAVFRTPGAPQVGVIVRGAASQTADLMQWQDSAGAVTARIRANGSSFLGSLDTGFVTATGDVRSSDSLLAPFIQDADKAKGYLATNQTALDFLLVNRVAGNVPLAVRGAASQTADLQQWQTDTGTVLTKVTAAGNLDFTASTRGPILTSPDGLVRRRVGIDNAGALTLTAV